MISKIYHTQTSLGSNSFSVEHSTKQGTARLKSASGKAFAETLRRAKTQPSPESLDRTSSQVNSFPNLIQSAQKQLGIYLDNWNDISRTIPQHVAQISKESQQLIQLQIRVNDLHQKTELFAKAGEAFSSSLRRVQQMGNG